MQKLHVINCANYMIHTWQAQVLNRWYWHLHDTGATTKQENEFPFGNYHPPTKLREGNVFSSVCLSVSHSAHRSGSQMTITHDVLDLTVQGLPSMFKLVHLRIPNQCWYLQNFGQNNFKPIRQLYVPTNYGEIAITWLRLFTKMNFMYTLNVLPFY